MSISRQIKAVIGVLIEKLDQPSAEISAMRIAQIAASEREVTVDAVLNVLLCVTDLDTAWKLAPKVSITWNAVTFANYSTIAAWQYLLESGMSSDQAGQWLDTRINDLRQ